MPPKKDTKYRTNLSIQYANQTDYLDKLFDIYPIVPEETREIDDNIRKNIEKSFSEKDCSGLIKNLLSLDLFPLKDSYVAYLRKDLSAIERNPKTIKRLCERIYKMWIDEVLEKCSEPKETNRQIGPLFRSWLNRWGLGIKPIKVQQFLSSNEDAVLDAGDNEMMAFAKKHLNYSRNKWLDFIGRFNGKYVIWEAKFLTDFGGHQNAQFADAIATAKTKGVKAIVVAILDGVVYKKGRNKMFVDITETYKDLNIMSALVLKDFLHQV